MATMALKGWTRATPGRILVATTLLMARRITMILRWPQPPCGARELSDRMLADVGLSRTVAQHATSPEIAALLV